MISQNEALHEAISAIRKGPLAWAREKRWLAVRRGDLKSVIQHYDNEARRYQETIERLYDLLTGKDTL